MKTTRAFAPGDRYQYDFDACSYARGWAQFDSDQDASYYGMWVNPSTLALFCYCEGDTTHHHAENEAEFCDMLRRIEAFEIDQGRSPPRIDPGFDDAMRARFVALGLADMLH